MMVGPSECAGPKPGWNGFEPVWPSSGLHAGGSYQLNGWCAAPEAAKDGPGAALEDHLQHASL